MFGIQQIISMLQNLTDKLNSWEQNAKTIPELTAATSADVSDLLHIARGTDSFKLRIGLLIDIIQNNLYDRLIYVGNITLSGTTLTVPSGARWQISSNNYVTNIDTDITIPLAASGKARKDLIVGNVSGAIVRVAGTEGIVSVRPNVPNNTVVITEIEIDDATINVGNPVYSNSSYFQGVFDSYTTMMSQISRPVFGSYAYVVNSSEITQYTNNGTDFIPTRLNNYKKFVEWSTGNSRSISVSEGVQVKNVFINETLIYSTADSSTYGKWSQASPGANVVISADVLFDDQSRILITN